MFALDLAHQKTDSQSAILQVYVFPDGRCVVHSGASCNLLLGVWEVSAGPDQIDSFVAGPSVHMLHDAVEVVLYGEFGKTQVGANFFVRQALGDEGNKLTLAERQA